MRVLFLTHRLPYAPNRGDRIRSYHLLRQLRSFAEVDLVSFVHSRAEASRARDLAELASSVRIVRVPRVRNWIRASALLPTSTPLTHLLLAAPSMRRMLRDLVRTNRPDVVLALCSGMARFGMEPPLTDVPLVVDMIDVDSMKWRLLADRTSPPKRWIYAREARTLSRFEGVVSRRAYASVVVNERERRALTDLAPSSRVHVIQMGIDLTSVAPSGPPVPSTDVVFCGVMSYPPNEEAVLWLADRVWPIVQQQHRQARLKIVGSSPTARVRALASGERRIEVTGAVPDVRPYLWSAAVSVAPVLTARGTQTKVFEAVGAGLPSVITSVVADGLPAELLPACTVADTPDAFAAAILERLALSPIQRRAAAQRVDLTALEWHRCLAPYRGILESAIDASDGRVAVV